MIKIENLTYKYSVGTPFEKVAVDHVNLDIEGGEIVGVIGHTGSGKSTLIQHLNGLLQPTEGRVLINGNDIWADKSKLRQVRFDVGLVFQYPEYQLFEETVYKDIAFGPRNMGLSEEEIKKRVLQAAEFSGLRPELLEKSPFDLSGGQKRRVAIAGVIAMEPKVLILDEPTAGLDPQGVSEILRLLLSLRDHLGMTILLSTHDMDLVPLYCDYAYVLRSGRVTDQGSPEELVCRPESLRANQLRLPRVAHLMEILAEEDGLPADRSAATIGAARKEILRLLKEEAK